MINRHYFEDTDDNGNPRGGDIDYTKYSCLRLFPASPKVLWV